MPQNFDTQPCQQPARPAERLAGRLAGRLAAPSFVIPAGVAENARFLAGKVDEVGLCLFETRACLNYGPQDLPPDLAALSLRWHAHLPVDLPWPQKSSATAQSAYPARTAATLACHVPLLLENVAHSDIHGLGKGFLQDHGLGLCLDVGHLLGYGQKNLLFSTLPEQASLVHWSAPGDGDRHLPLTDFTGPQMQTAADLMARFCATAVHMAEIFNWKGLADSLPVLEAFAQPQPAL